MAKSKSKLVPQELSLFSRTEPFSENAPITASPQSPKGAPAQDRVMEAYSGIVSASQESQASTAQGDRGEG